MWPRFPRRDEEFRPTGGKLSPLEPRGRPGKRAAAEVCLPPAGALLPWFSMRLRLLARTSNAELRRSSVACLPKSPVCKLPPFPAGADDMSDSNDGSFPVPEEAPPAV